MCREIHALREVLPKESVCVFVGAALPGASGITKIHLSVRRQGEGFVVREFHSFSFAMTSFEVGIHPFEPVVLMLQFFKPLHIRGVQPPYLAFHLHSTWRN